MGKILQTSIALILTSFIVGYFILSMYSISFDPAKDNYTFSMYGNYNNKTTKLLENGTVVYENSNNTMSNFQMLSETIQNTIAEEQNNFTGNYGIAEKLLNAFGLTAKLLLNVLYLFLAVIAEGINFAYGITTNLYQLPPPWGAIGFIGTLAVVLAVVYLVFKMIAVYAKWDI